MSSSAGARVALAIGPITAAANNPARVLSDAPAAGPLMSTVFLRGAQTACQVGTSTSRCALAHTKNRDARSTISPSKFEIAFLQICKVSRAHDLPGLHFLRVKSDSRSVKRHGLTPKLTLDFLDGHNLWLRIVTIAELEHLSRGWDSAIIYAACLASLLEF